MITIILCKKDYPVIWFSLEQQKQYPLLYLLGYSYWFFLGWIWLISCSTFRRILLLRSHVNQILQKFAGCIATQQGISNRSREDVFVGWCNNFHNPQNYNLDLHTIFLQGL